MVTDFPRGGATGQVGHPGTSQLSVGCFDNTRKLQRFKSDEGNLSVRMGIVIYQEGIVVLEICVRATMTPADV